MKKVYFDNNATTPPHPGLVSCLLEKAPESWGNPSSVHWAGQAIKGPLREARQNLASLLGVSPLELVFTSGGSESNSTVVMTFFKILKETSENSLTDFDVNRNEFITSTVEHPSIKKSFEWLESQGYKVHWIGFDSEGNFDIQKYASVLSEQTLLVSTMLVNNETGLVLPVRKITEMAHKVGAFVHTDAVQALGKIEVKLNELGVDYASFSAHKFYALKGSGLLYSKKGAPLSSLVFGGGQERHRRGGTENSFGILSMGYMARLLLDASYVEGQREKLTDLRNYFEQRLEEKIDRIQINHRSADRAGGTSSVVLEDVEGEALLMALDVRGFAVSTGSACSSGSSQPSASLRAFGLSAQQARSTLRVSFGWQNTMEEVDLFIDELKGIVERLRRLVLKNSSLVAASSQGVSLVSTSDVIV